MAGIPDLIDGLLTTFCTGPLGLVLVLLLLFALMMAKKRKPKPEPRYLTETQAEALLAVAAADPDPRLRHRDLALMRLMLTNLRNAEALAVQAEDITFGDGGEHPVVWVRHGKGAKDRRAPISRETARALMMLLRQDDGTLRTEGPLFKIKTTRACQQMVKKRARQAMLPRWEEVTPHTLRHTFAVACHKRNMRDTTLQELLGHANISTTKKYLLLSGKDHEEEIDRVGGLPF